MNLGQHILVFGVRIYRGVISPAKLFVLGSVASCRFTPSCSAYAIEAIRRHGAVRGSLLALKRICRCHPFGGCGHDPVPPIRNTSKRETANATKYGINTGGGGETIKLPGEPDLRLCTHSAPCRPCH